MPLIPPQSERYLHRQINSQPQSGRACPTNGSDRGSLRDHDLTLLVRQKAETRDWLATCSSRRAKFLRAWRRAVSDEVTCEAINAERQMRLTVLRLAKR